MKTCDDCKVTDVVDQLHLCEGAFCNAAMCDSCAEFDGWAYEETAGLWFCDACANPAVGP